MNDVASALSADAILAIPDDRPGFLFSGSAVDFMREYRALVKQWHPDVSKDPRAADVVHKIGMLKDAADKRLMRTWIGRDEISILGTDGKRRTARYRRMFRTDLGETAYGNGVIVHLVKPEYAGLFADGLRTIGSLPYRTPKIRGEVERYMPKVRTSFEADDGMMVLVIDKTKDVFSVRDVIAAMGGFVDPKHVAWMMNAALNIACYLDDAGLAHHAITQDSFYVSPKHHSGLLLGDWWFASKQGRTVTWVPSAAHALLDIDMSKTRQASIKLDLAMIRMMGRTMLGDGTGMSLVADNRVPRLMTDWLRSAPGERAVDDYRIWSTEVLPACFGKRQFVKLDLSDRDIFA